MVLFFQFTNHISIRAAVRDYWPPEHTLPITQNCKYCNP